LEIPDAAKEDAEADESNAADVGVGSLAPPTETSEPQVSGSESTSRVINMMRESFERAHDMDRTIGYTAPGLMQESRVEASLYYSMAGRTVNSTELEEHVESAPTAISIKTGMASFCSTYGTVDERNRQMREMFESRELDNMYAIVIPSAGGKSELAQRLGIIDVDSCIGGTMQNKIFDLRGEELSRGDKANWVYHNRMFYYWTSRTLRRLPKQAETQFVLVHTVEMAYGIGLRPILVARPEQRLHEATLRQRRYNNAQQLARANWRILGEQAVKELPIFEYQSFSELFTKVYSVVGRWREIPCPHRYGPVSDVPFFKGYSKDVPEWIMQLNKPTSKTALDAIRIVESYYKEGHIPDVCFAAWQQEYWASPSVEVAGSVSITEWIMLFADVDSELAQFGPKYTSEEMTQMLQDAETDWFVVYPFEKGANERVSNMSVRSIVREFQSEILEDSSIIDIMRFQAGSSHLQVCAILWYVLGVLGQDQFKWLREAVLKSGLLCLSSAEGGPKTPFVTQNKRAHELIRRTRTFGGVKLKTLEEYAVALYTNILRSRMPGKPDLAAEMIGRTTVRDKKLAYDLETGWSNETYMRYLKDALREYYAALGQRVMERGVRHKSFSEFWKSRYTWAKSGGIGVHHEDKSLSSAIIEFFTNVTGGDRLMENKRTYFERDGLFERFVDFCERHIGFNRSKVVTKYESGKLRLLLPGSIYHYVLFSFIMNLVDGLDTFGTTVGGKGSDDSIALLDRMLKAKLEKFMYDYEDFNAQHTIEEMQCWAEAMWEELAAASDSVDGLVFAMASSIEAFEKSEIILEHNDITEEDMRKLIVEQKATVVELSDEKGRSVNVERWREMAPGWTIVILTESGLFSGWRITADMNNALRSAQSAVAERSKRELSIGSQHKTASQGIATVDEIGTGDDAESHLDGIVSSMLHLAVKEKTGYVAQREKQMHSYNQGEFTRMTTDENGVFASICRLLGNFVAGNWISEAEATPEGRLTASYDVVSKLERAGLSEQTAVRLRKCLLRHWGRFKDTNDEWVSINPVIMHSSKSQNGMGVPDANGVMYTLTRSLEAKETLKDSHKFVQHTSMSRDQAEKVAMEVKDSTGGEIELEIGKATLKMANQSYSKTLEKALVLAPEHVALLEKYYNQNVGTDNIMAYAYSTRVDVEATKQQLRAYLEWANNGNVLSKYTKQMRKFAYLKEYDGCLKSSATGEKISFIDMLDPVVREVEKIVGDEVGLFNVPFGKGIPEPVATSIKEYVLDSIDTVIHAPDSSSTIHGIRRDFCGLVNAYKSQFPRICGG
jgi:hypothetical protein